MAYYDLAVSGPPHIRSKEVVSTGMRDVLIALVPVVAVSLVYFRLDAVITFASCIVAAIVSEAVMRKIMGRELTLKDYSAIVTAVLLALCLPPALPWWYAAIGTIVAVAIMKELMGGLGVNIFNPALFGFAFLIICSRWLAGLNSALNSIAYRGSISGVTTATPLAWVKPEALSGPRPGYWSLFLANPGGAIGEVSVLALLVGAAYLLYRGHITWHIPFSIIATVFVLTAILGQNPLYAILAGGVMLGAFFMATDWVTSPSTNVGKIIFGIGIGVLIVVIRLYAAPLEGVAYAILIFNALTPLINRIVKKKWFGAVKA